MNLEGLWISKIILELYILSSYAILIHLQDWYKISQISRAKLEIDEARTHELHVINSPKLRIDSQDKMSAKNQHR